MLCLFWPTEGAAHLFLQATRSRCCQTKLLWKMSRFIMNLIPNAKMVSIQTMGIPLLAYTPNMLPGYVAHLCIVIFLPLAPPVSSHLSFILYIVMMSHILRYRISLLEERHDIVQNEHVIINSVAVILYLHIIIMGFKKLTR